MAHDPSCAAASPSAPITPFEKALKHDILRIGLIHLDFYVAGALTRFLLPENLRTPLMQLSESRRLAQYRHKFGRTFGIPDNLVIPDEQNGS